MSILAGVLVAYGAFAVIAAVVGAVLGAIGFDTTQLGTNDWRQLGIGSGIAVGLSLFLAYLFGGYVAGRMARRAGAMNGLLVFVLGILVAGGIGAAIGAQADTEALAANLRSIGVPTTGSEWSAIGTAAGLGALAAMLLGALGGGLAGERWHGKLVARALDPTVGTTAGSPTTEAPRTDDTRTVDLRDRQSEKARGDRTGEETLITGDGTTGEADTSRTRTMH
ncbi:MAG: hypothetical protein KY454_09680 [Actinobacteria bacterium]|nr:hypothetical protein [Actinomycetota bacterium]